MQFAAFAQHLQCSRGACIAFASLCRTFAQPLQCRGRFALHVCSLCATYAVHLHCICATFAVPLRPVTLAQHCTALAHRDLVCKGTFAETCIYIYISNLCSYYG